MQAHYSQSRQRFQRPVCVVLPPPSPSHLPPSPQGLYGIQARFSQPRQRYRRPVRVIMAAANPESRTVFCLTECNEPPPSCCRDLDVLLLELQCIGRHHCIVKLDMSGEDEGGGVGSALLSRLSRDWADEDRVKNGRWGEAAWLHWQ